MQVHDEDGSEMPSYNMTELKRKARDEHIDESGRTERRNIFATIVKDVVGIEQFDLWEKKYQEDDFEEAYQHTSVKRAVVMKTTRSGGYRVFAVLENGSKDGEKEFGFSGKKKAESHMLELLEKHE